MMKIAYILGSLNRGGAETLVLDIFKNHRPSDFNLVCIHRKSGVLKEEFKHTNVPMIHLSVKKNVFSYLYRLRNTLKRHAVDVIHVHQLIDALFVWLVFLGQKKKIIFTLHGYDFQKKKSQKFLLGFILGKTDKNIYVSNAQKEYYQTEYKLDKKNQITIYNGISFSKIDSFTFSSLRNELGIDQNSLLLGSVGNFVPGRDQMTICRFLKGLNEQTVDFHFVFVGKYVNDSSYFYDACVLYCHNNNLTNKVTFLGLRSDVPNIVSQLDAFIYSTKHDTFGIAMVEAMSLGVPLFVNDWSVANEITKNGEYATLYKTKDESSLLSCFMHFISNRITYYSKATKAKLYVRDKFSIKQHVENLKEVYKSVI